MDDFKTKKCRKKNCSNISIHLEGSKLALAEQERIQGLDLYKKPIQKPDTPMPTKKSSKQKIYEEMKRRAHRYLIDKRVTKIEYLQILEELESKLKKGGLNDRSFKEIIETKKINTEF